ncbi:hypothetical protein DLS51_12920, partial [Staphylococcus pseudintermedius]|uniref:NFACT family protein n=1 Tax=Staphylococcus pseudintermedius TaxID=283734 RepID=UPI0010F3C8E1
MKKDLHFLFSGHIQKINQPKNYKIIMFKKKQHQNHQFCLSIPPYFARFHPPQKKYDDPFKPPMFARVFRK